MTDDRETVPCRLCGRPTPMTGTKLCDAHFELESRVPAEPDLARRILSTKEGAGEPVAVVGEGFAIFWAGSGPIAPIVEKHGLKVGSMLYAAPPAVMPAAPSDAMGVFAIEVEKLLCKKLGIDWAPAGMSIESLVDRLAAPAAGEQAGAVAQVVPMSGGKKGLVFYDAKAASHTPIGTKLYAAPGAAIAAREQEAKRTPQDYAIEHAEYMATTAEGLIEAVNDLAKAEQERDDGSANPSDVDAAQETVSEYLGTLRNRIYEFRKRKDRALALPKEAPATPPAAIPFVERKTENVSDNESCGASVSDKQAAVMPAAPSDAVREALQELLNGIHAGRFVPLDGASKGYCASLVDAGESALSQTMQPQAEHPNFETWWLMQIANAQNRRDGDDHLDLDDCDKSQYRAAFEAGARTSQAEPAAGEQAGAVTKLYVECRECSNCGHIGINDDADGMAACNTCEWNGPSPKEDHCPGCGRDGTMSGSCPECGHRTTLIAEANLAALTQTTTVQQAEPDGWRAALQFYADRSHFNVADDDAWDTVSGEPQNFWCDEAGTATVEDGTVAAMALRGTPLRDEDDGQPGERKDQA